MAGSTAGVTGARGGGAAVWVWVTALGLVVEVGVIVLLGRAAIRRTERDEPAPPPARPRTRVTSRVTTHVTVPLPALPMPPVTARAAVRQATRRAAPAARR
jgi:hypothetical protein